MVGRVNLVNFGWKIMVPVEGVEGFLLTYKKMKIGFEWLAG